MMMHSHCIINITYEFWGRQVSPQARGEASRASLTVRFLRYEVEKGLRAVYSLHNLHSFYKFY